MSMAIRKTAGMRARRNIGREKRGKGGPASKAIGRSKRAREHTIQPIGSPSSYTPPSTPTPEFQSAVSNHESTLTETGIESGGTTPGPNTPPTTYGTDPFEAYGLPGGLPNGDETMSTADMTEPGGGVPETGVMPSPAKVKGPKKRSSPGPDARKQKLLHRVARTTGATRGEARGVMRKARVQVRRGNTAGARKTISRALSGEARAGVKRTPQRTAKANVAAKKITKRIATRQAAAPKRRKK
jgi:hypothetical protein